MRFELRTLLPLAASVVLASFGCSSKGKAGAGAGDEAASQPASASPSQVDEPDETVESGETGDEPAPAAEVIEINAPEADFDGKTVPVRAITLTPATVEWRELGRFDGALELVRVASGVVARSPAGVHDLDEDGQLRPWPGLTLPDAPLLGHWPDDVWYVEGSPVEPADDGRERAEYRAFRLDEQRNWQPQRYRGKDRWIGEAGAVRKGWHAGLLVREGSTLTRLGSRKDAPKIGVRMGKVILETIETASGRLYNISLRPTGIYAQQACFNRTCIDDHAKKLPFGSEWRFGAQIPRQRNSVSVLATVDDGGVVSHQLLHYEIGGWSLESLVHEPSGLWPAADGGLWLVVRSELRYRTRQGHWYAIALPEGVTKLSAAMRSGLDELWVAAQSGGETQLYATDAIVAELPEPGPSTG